MVVQARSGLELFLSRNSASLHSGIGASLVINYGNLKKKYVGGGGQGVSCNGLTSHPGGVEILPVAS